eukprot:TRINITY_DN14940_c0_g2_i2.p1 TRINITY_DN14940_c0_g2~~TRINITY_DN14940_c0_g2_i2.p1  ORF type:complete len:508 (+),score=105.95 TRINITY_DN14940_c0_g2_i2:176-1699(+)
MVEVLAREDEPVFKAEWNSSIRPVFTPFPNHPWITADTTGFTLTAFLLFVIPQVPGWIAWLAGTVAVLALLRRLLHAYIVGPIIFPAQNVARDAMGVFMNMMTSLGVDPALMGQQGVLELRSRRQVLVASFPGAVNHRIETPDGVLLDLVHYLTAARDLSGPTCVYFNANMQLVEGQASHTVAQMYLEAGVNLVMFNYRGVCESNGKLTKRGTIIDGESVFQYVNVHCRVPQDQIVLHARSIGGGIAAQVAGLHPSVKMCSDRSFSSLLHVIRLSIRKICKVETGVAPPSPAQAEGEAPPKMMHHGSPTVSNDSQPPTRQDAPVSCMPMVRMKMVSKLRQCVAWSLTGLAWGIGWDLVAEDHWCRIVGRKWLFYHPEDGMIPLDSSLYAAVKQKDPSGHTEFYRMGGQANGHNRAFTIPEKAWHMTRVREALGLEGEEVAGHISGKEWINPGGDDRMVSISDCKWSPVEDEDAELVVTPEEDDLEDLESLGEESFVDGDDTNQLLRP